MPPVGNYGQQSVTVAVARSQARLKTGEGSRQGEVVADDKMPHFVSASAHYWRCGFTEWKTGLPTGSGYKPCDQPATHKVGEEIPWDDPVPNRHNLTMYVCCKHFGQILGYVARERCSEGVE